MRIYSVPHFYFYIVYFSHRNVHGKMFAMKNLG